MDDLSTREAFASFSRGEISRIELGRRLGREISFGDMLLQLREYGLPLPIYSSDRNSPGVRLIKELALRAVRE